MQRYLLIFSAIVLLSVVFKASHLHAQPEYDLFLIKEVVPFGGEGFVAVFLDHPERPKQMRLEFFAPDNRSLGQKVISLDRRGIEAKFEGVFAWNGRLLVLTSLYYPGPQRNYLMLQQYALPDFSEISGIVVDEAYTPQLYRVPFGFSISPDSSKLMVYAWSYSLPEDPARLSVTILGQDLDTLWQQRYVLPYKNASLYLYDCRVTDDGRAFLVGENYTGKVGPVIDENKIEYFVLSAVPGDENMIIYDINPQGYALRGLHIDPVPGNAMAGAAFYQEPGKGVHLGIYSFYIPPSGGKMEQGLVPVEKETYQMAYAYSGGDGILNMNRHRFESYQVRSVRMLPDGSLLAVAEQEYYSPTEGVYEYNDILIIRLQPGLQNMKWIRRLPKRQSQGFSDSPLSSFSFKEIRKGDRLYFLFNDLAAHHTQPGGPRALGRYWGDDGIVVAAELEMGTGKMRLFNLSRLLRPKSIQKAWISHCWDLNGRGLLIFGGGPSLMDENKLFDLEWAAILDLPARNL